MPVWHLAVVCATAEVSRVVANESGSCAVLASVLGMSVGFMVMKPSLDVSF